MNDVIKKNSKGIEFVRCCVCGGQETAVHFRISVREDQQGTYGRDVWDIVRCQTCGLIYTNPRPDADALTSYYQFGNAYDAQFIQDWFISNADLQRPTWQRYLHSMAHWGNAGSLLDVGCGAGTFLLEAQKMGHQVMGQEIAPYFIEYCQTEHGLSIFDAEIEDVPLEPASLDWITTFDVIEHHPDPRRLVEESHKLLKTGGKLVVGTHDIGNIYAKLYGDKWRYLTPIGHLTYFSKETLQKLLVDCGFEILQAGGIHTLDPNPNRERLNKVVQFFRVIVLRALVIGVYKPVTNLLPLLQNWSMTWGDKTFNHKKLVRRAGDQIVMDDNVIVIAQKK